MVEVEGYRILERLKGPGYADLYLAADEHGGEHLLYVVEDPPENFTPWVDQLRHLAVLLPHLASIRGGGVSGSTAWVATERCAGPTLARLVPNAPDPANTPVILQEISEFAAVLKTAHQLGFVHGDLCPEHILACRDKKFRIIAFGFAELFGMTAEIAEERPEYRAPEQFVDDPEPDPRADIYSLGMVLYEMIACQRPFPGMSGGALVECALTRMPQPLETLVPLPNSVSALVAKAIAKHPDARHQTMVELISELRAATEDWYRWRDESKAAATGAHGSPGSDVARHHDTASIPGEVARGPSNRPTLPSVTEAPPPVPSLNAPLPAIPPPARTPLPPTRRRRATALVAATAVVLGALIGLVLQPSPPLLTPFAAVQLPVFVAPPPAPTPAPAPAPSLPRPRAPQPSHVVAVVYSQVEEPPQEPAAPPAPSAPRKALKCRTKYYACGQL